MVSTGGVALFKRRNSRTDVIAAATTLRPHGIHRGGVKRAGAIGDGDKNAQTHREEGPVEGAVVDFSALQKSSLRNRPTPSRAVSVRVQSCRGWRLSILQDCDESRSRPNRRKSKRRRRESASVRARARALVDAWPIACKLSVRQRLIERIYHAGIIPA